MKRRSVLFLALVCALIMPAQEKVASVEGITEYRFPNGLRLVLFPDASKPTITVNLTYLVGSRHENYGEAGMAHILEHLVSYGSPKHPDAKKEQADRGARRNASTWFDRTNYYETFPASDANLEWALDLEADRMVNAFVKKDILESQMTVVRNEFEAGENSPAGVLIERVLSTAYLWHNYGKSTIGARSDIENVPIERLLAFYRTYYQPDNAVAVVAGRFDEAKALGVAAATLGKIPRATRTLPQTYTAEPPQDGERTVTLRRSGDVQLAAVAYHIPAGPHPDFAPLAVLTNVLASSPAGRLHKALVETKKAAAVRGFQWALREPGSALYLATVRKEASLDDARATLLRVLDSLAAEPVNEQEAGRARTQLVSALELELNNSEQIGLELSEWASQGDWRLLFLYRDWLRRVTADDVQRVAQAYYRASNRTIGTFIPEAQPLRAEIPPPPDVAAAVKDYKGDAAATAGEVFDPSPANIDRRSIRKQIPGGARLVLVPKKTRGGTVTGVLRLHFGSQTSLQDRGAESELARMMLMRGAAKRTRQQIQDDLSRLKARVNVGGDGGFVEVSIETVRASLPETLKLVAEILREPSFPAEEFEQLRQLRLAQNEAALSEPQSLAMTHFNRHMSPYPKGDARYVETPEERIAGLKAAGLDAVRRFHQQFYGASDSELALAGDFDAAEVERLSAQLLDGWKSTEPYAEIQRPYQKIAAAARAIETPDKANAVFYAGMRFNAGDEHPDYPALVLANYMLGGHSASRLYLRIRAKEGLSYGVGSALIAQPRENNAQFTAFAISNPQNVPKVEKAFREEVDRALKEGFAGEEVAAAKKGWLESQQVNRSQDQGLARRLRSHLQYGRTMAFDAELEKKIQALTPEDATAALRRHLDPAQISVFTAGDFRPQAGGR